LYYPDSNLDIMLAVRALNAWAGREGLPFALLTIALIAMDSSNHVSGLHAYGHAYGPRPLDFTPGQYAAIASRFAIFTVEKDHAAAVYGNISAPPPSRTNSIAATVGTARKIKALNANVKVLLNRCDVVLILLMR